MKKNPEEREERSRKAKKLPQPERKEASGRKAAGNEERENPQKAFARGKQIGKRAKQTGEALLRKGKEAMTRILLVRHCEAEGNHKRIFQGHTDSEISENGARQLEMLALRCRNMPIEAIYSSPLRRAVKTAEAINRFHQLPITLDAGLMEINGGHWEGKLWTSFHTLYPQEARHWDLEPHLFAPEGGEPMKEVYERIWSTVLGIVRANPDRLVCVASHGCAIRNFLCRAAGNPIEKLNDTDWGDNTAISIVDFDKELRPTIVLQNDASHLTEELSTFAKQDWWKPENRGKISND